MRNSSLYGTRDLIDRFMSALRNVGPTETLNKLSLTESPATPEADARLTWNVMGQSFKLALDVEVSPIGTQNLPPAKPAGTGGEVGVFLAPFISRSARVQLEKRGLSYWDPTGNLLLQSRDPFLWVQQFGSVKNPSPIEQTTTLQSLKGRSASEVVVRLLANGGAPSVRDLARETGVSLGTVSRVVSLLRNEDFLKPTGGGPIVITDPLKLARRWAEDYSFAKTFGATRYFSILGLDLARERIAESGADYALTGLAAQSLYYNARDRVAPLPASDLWLYAEDVSGIVKLADLVPDTANGNIMVAQANFITLGREGYLPNGDARSVWPWRAVGDLLSMSGRYVAAGSDWAEYLVENGMTPYG